MNDHAIVTDAMTRDFKSVRAVNELTIEVPRGILFGFLGPNGSGKTTTIRLLLGLLEPNQGRAEVLGFNPKTQADQIRAHCGALLEHTGLYERLTAEDNLDFYGRIWHVSAAERQARTLELLKSLGLWDRRKDLVGSWSRGMKQKLAVARALFHRPELIFLDEPTSGLDPVAASALHETLIDLAARQGVTVFLTTHNLAEAEKLCGQVAVIHQGKLLAQGSPTELRAKMSSPRVEFVGRGFTPAAIEALRGYPKVTDVAQSDGHLIVDLKEPSETAPLVTLLVSKGAEIEEVRKDQASLEDVFLKLVEEEK
ncbi:MAG: ABC transporter ATP-binding protein [Chloroflexi bacterium]|nr:ABC transporter ATP-binding protein [Chloroflexota bacterium]